MNTQDLITSILANEGAKYTDDPSDRGGPTKYGITQANLAIWRGHPVTPDDVKNLTEAEARAIYRREYVDKPGFGQIADPTLQALVVDIGVNQGQPTAAKFLQTAAGVTADGNCGPKTLAAVNAMAPVSISIHPLLPEVLAQSLRGYGRLITNQPSQARFAAGWMNRRTQLLDSIVGG